MSKKKRRRPAAQQVTAAPAKPEKSNTGFYIIMGFLVLCFALSIWELFMGPASMPGHSRIIMPLIFAAGIVYLWYVKAHPAKKGAR